VLIAITGQTGTGIAVVDLSGLAEPPALPYVGVPGVGRVQADGVAVGVAVERAGSDVTFCATEDFFAMVTPYASSPSRLNVRSSSKIVLE